MSQQRAKEKSKLCRESSPKKPVSNWLSVNNMLAGFEKIQEVNPVNEEALEILKELVKAATTTATKELIKKLVKKAFESLSNKKEKKGS